MNAGSKDSITGIIALILNPSTSDERVRILTSNLWHRGTALSKHKERIDREVSNMERQRSSSLKKAARRKVSKTLLNRTRIKKAKVDL